MAIIIFRDTETPMPLNLTRERESRERDREPKEKRYMAPKSKHIFQPWRPRSPSQENNKPRINNNYTQNLNTKKSKKLKSR